MCRLSEPGLTRATKAAPEPAEFCLGEPASARLPSVLRCRDMLVGARSLAHLEELDAVLIDDGVAAAGEMTSKIPDTRGDGDEIAPDEPIDPFPIHCQCSKLIHVHNKKNEELVVHLC